MDEELETLVVGIRADTRAFERDVQRMRGDVEGPFARGFERAGEKLETSLLSAIRRGKLGFDDLKQVALSVLSDIAANAIRSGIGAVGGGGASQPGHGGLLSGLVQIVGSLSGAAGRATGGPVSPGQAYRVGENGPEWFVPTSAGRVETGFGGQASAPIQLNIRVSDNGAGSAPKQIERSARHVAHAVRNALQR